MKLLDQHREITQQLHNYFGYTEQWRVLPYDDAREYFWQLHAHVVRFAETEAGLADEALGNYYENAIYTQRHLSKWVYRGEQYTMIVVDTHCDGNQFLQVFDNAKEVK